MSYKYDVFISYPGENDIASWIIDYFVDELGRNLNDYTLYHCQMRAETFFVDVSEMHPESAKMRRKVEGIMPGDDWQQKVEDALRHSRCMIALCSPSYFDSIWCHLEMSTFWSRQKSSSTTLITPVSLRPRHMLPFAEWRESKQTFEIEDYVTGASDYRDTRTYYDFGKYMIKIADAVARSVCAAPDFQHWPTVVTDPALPPPGRRRPVATANFR